MGQISVENLTFSYQKNNVKTLENVCFSVQKGEFVLICGNSGSGKTTLLKMLKPSEKVDGQKSGDIFFNGEKLRDDRITDFEIGYVMQSPENQIVTDTVWKELAFGLENMGLKNEEIKARIAEISIFFGIEKWYHKKTSELSGGQKQILNLASIMVLRPKVLLLDEPTSQLDPSAKIKFIALLKKINQELATTILMAEHQTKEIFTIADKIAIMENGRLINYNTPNEVLKYEKKCQFELPAWINIWLNTGKVNNCPMSLSDGKTWLLNMPKVNDIELKNINDTVTKEAISLKDVSFGYKKEEMIVKNSTFDIKKGKIFSILGGNGAGKSTLLKLMYGAIKPVDGKIKIDGKVSLLPQNPQILFSKSNVKSEIYLELKNDKENEKIINLCKLNDLLEKHPYDLSGGQQQKLALCKILLQNPDIILLDEPTKGFDLSFKNEFGEILKTLQNCGKTIIIVSHDLEFCAKYTQECALLFDGELVFKSEKREFFIKNKFFTTQACKLSNEIIENAIIDEEIIEILGGKSETKKTLNPPIKSVIESKDKVKEKSSKSKKNTGIFTFFMTLLTIVILHNILKLNDYWVISIIVITEVLFINFLKFVKKRPNIGEIVLISTLSALAICGRVVFFMLPQIKPVLAVVIIVGATLGGEIAFLVGAMSMFVSNMMFGQGPWTPVQMVATGIIGVVSACFFYGKEIKKVKISIFGAVSTVLIYGLILDVFYGMLILSESSVEGMIAYVLTGLPMNIIYGISTSVFLYLFAKPMSEKINRVKYITKNENS